MKNNFLYIYIFNTYIIFTHFFKCFFQLLLSNIIIINNFCIELVTISYYYNYFIITITFINILLFASLLL
jgi:hypothetical protein